LHFTVESAKYKTQCFFIDGLDSEILTKKFKLIYDASIGIQTELGLMLIAIESYKDFKKDEENRLLSVSLFRHHYYICIECIYRVWERFSHVLNYIHTSNPKKKEYYNEIIDEIYKCNQYSEKVTSQLKKHQKHWSKIAEVRNLYSHENSTLLLNGDFDLSLVVDWNGLPFPKNVRLKWKEDFDFIKQKYEYLKKLDNSTIAFFEEVRNKTYLRRKIWLPRTY